MKNLYCAAALALLAACAPPPSMTPPAPTLVTSTLAPNAVAQSAVQVLATRGFTVTIADAVGGTVVATRAIPAGNPELAKDILACQWGPDAVGWNWIAGTMTITITARAAAGGSAVTIVGTAQTAVHTGMGMLPDPAGSASYCASNGKTEAAIATAITTP